MASRGSSTAHVPRRRPALLGAVDRGPVREFRLCPKRGCPYVEAGDSHHVTGHVRSAHGESIPYQTRILRVEEWLMYLVATAIQFRYGQVQNPFEKQPGWHPSLLNGWKVALFRPLDGHITQDTVGFEVVSGFKWPKESWNREMFAGLAAAKKRWEKLIQPAEN